MIDGGHNVRKVFMCSLCHNGILGGGLYLDTVSGNDVNLNIKISNREFTTTLIIGRDNFSSYNFCYTIVVGGSGHPVSSSYTHLYIILTSKNPSLYILKTPLYIIKL